MKHPFQVFALILFLVLIGWPLQQILTLDNLKAVYHELEAWHHQQPVWSALLFFVTYLSMVALSLPGLTLLMLTGGALFGLTLGTVLVSFAASIGSTLAFLLSRHLLHDWVQARWGERLTTIQNGFARDGTIYLLTLRLLPVIPSFLVNLLMGLTPIPVRTFYWVSQVGMLAATLLYVQAGTQLTQLNQPSDILSPELFVALLLLALLPVLANVLLKRYKQYHTNVA
ncbi:MAG: TVP38/TMEM64 family protein [Magnetococcales bacterium]|nr:TVP38/TMEM64 family protein [Magnetococcales bacterium]